MKKVLLLLLIAVALLGMVACSGFHIHTASNMLIVKEATCGKDGMAYMMCSTCGEVVNVITLPKTEAHTEIVISGTESTCSEHGLTEGKECSACGEILVAQKEAPLKAHTEETIAAVESTCTEHGLTEGKQCTVCGTITVPQEKAPLVPHTYDNDNDAICNVCKYERYCVHHNTKVLEAIESTCTKTGLAEGKQCVDCKEILIAQEILPLKSHTEVIDPRVEPTCTSTGLTEGSHCSVCGTIIVEQTVIGMLEHTEVIDARVDSTCKTTGLTEGKHCLVCKAILINQIEIPTIDHIESDWIIDKKSTTTETGSRHKECIFCEVVLETETIPILTVSMDLEFVLNDDGKSYSVTGIGTCIDTVIVIPDKYNGLPVTAILDSALIGRKSIISVIIPDSVISIGDYAFANCYSLTNITIPNSVTGIGTGVFLRCYSLESITIPNSVTDIGERAFEECFSLASVKISESVTNIRKDTFFRCYSLTSITIPASITNIENLAFSGCYSLVEVCNKSSLKITAAPNSLNGSVGYWAKQIITDETQSAIKYVGDYIFYDDGTDVYLVKYVGNETDITLPQYNGGQEYKIKEYAFYKKTEIISVTIPESVTRIMYQAFDSCTSLTRIVIPSSMETIIQDAFIYCYSLVEVCNKSSLNITAGRQENGYVGYYAEHIITDESQSAIKYVGDYVFYDDGVNVYLVKYFGDETDLVLPEYNNGQAYEIYKYAFYESSVFRNKKITSVKIPFSVTGIGYEAFYGCTYLESVDLPNSVTHIDARAFYDAGLKNIVIPDSVTSIGYGAFNERNSLTIYCEAESKPDGWVDSWNYSNCPVVWGYTGK